MSGGTRQAVDETPTSTDPAGGHRWTAWARWTASFLEFPLAGLAGLAAVGRVDDPVSALVGGAVTGAVIGAGQALASRAPGGLRLPLLRWVAATSTGMGAGLALGAGAVGYGTGLADLAVQGAVTGVALGAAQALALPDASRRWAWAAASPALWSLGWTVTTLIGVDVERQYTVFGAAGALTYSALSGLVLRSGSHRSGATCSIRQNGWPSGSA